MIQRTHNSKTLLFLIISLSLMLHILCMTGANLLVEEAYYWNYAQHLDFSYLDHPPMVALLIKTSTTLFGNQEWSVRLGSLLCWFITAFFSYKLSELIYKGAGGYALMLLAVLPFYFLQTLVITPDLPLIACWSASLYCLYRALVMNQADYWYLSGVSLGLGMLSKYTISLLGLATLFFVIALPGSRTWFKRKEPYIAVLIAAFLFSPVIYWNASHQWVSFLFQSKRRFASTSSMDLHYLIGLIFLFITPLGALGLWELFKKNTGDSLQTPGYSRQFMQIFTLVPLGFFALFSLNHEVNLNWIGPLFLALIPWLAALAAHIPNKRKLWSHLAFFLLFCYSTILIIATYNTSETLQQRVFLKAIAWESLVKQFNDLAAEVEATSHKKVIFIPLDNFPIGSELSFYQKKLLVKGKISKTYPIVGAHLFGVESLMYRYWSKYQGLSDAKLILITKESWRFLLPELKKLSEQSKMEQIWSTGQGKKVKNIPFYYKIAQM